ncbi:MAG: hypothetical protein IJ306_06225, partial [Oscillospiraceae bacterium]|nr:hypothetical protein [Oscillospiraceae bacterium]
MNKENLTGIIQTKDKPIFFSNYNYYDFSFLTDNILFSGGKNEITKIPTENGFLYGKTHNNQDIAIYVGTDS